VLTLAVVASYVRGAIIRMTPRTERLSWGFSSKVPLGRGAGNQLSATHHSRASGGPCATPDPGIDVLRRVTAAVEAVAKDRHAERPLD
jgi:hypothetical protein